MMPCDQDRELLAAYLDGEVPSERATALEQHLSTCTDCAAQVASTLSLRRTMRMARTRFAPVWTSGAEFNPRLCPGAAASEPSAVCL